MSEHRVSNLFDRIPKKFDEEVFEILAEKQAVKIERILSKGHTSPQEGWYEQSFDEWVIVMQGSAKIEFDGSGIEHLGVGDYLNIVAGKKHRVIWTDPDVETVWLAVHY